MNKTLAIISAISAFSATSALAAYDGTITLADQPSGTSGGPFTATIQTTGPGAGLTGAAPSFSTFCLERSEFLNFSTTFNVKVSNAAMKGGNSSGLLSPDPLSQSTAWLYKKFIDGSLNGIGEYTSADADTSSVDALQNAIWFLEEELGQSGDPGTASWVPLATPGGQYDGLVNAALAANGIAVGNYTAARAQNNTAYPEVRVMNLYTGDEANPNFHQDLLIVVPEPSTYIAGGLALLPLLFGLRTRIAKK